MAVALAGLGAALAWATSSPSPLAYPMAKRAGSPMRQAAPGYGSYTFGGILASLAGVGDRGHPGDPRGRAHQHRPRRRSGRRCSCVCSAAYGLALAWAGVRIAARAAEGRLPELCQIAVRTKL